MTYATNLLEEGIESQFLAVFKPRRVVDTFTLVTGTIYKKSFTFGQIIEVKKNNTTLALGSSSSVSADQFYYDVDTSELFINISANPNTVIITVTYELYVGTFDAHFFRVPTDNTTRTVYFEPLVVKSPLITSSVSDQLFGFLPTQSTKIVVSNVTQFWNEHASISSFNGASLSVYHVLGEFDVANVKKVFEGYTKQVTWSDIELLFTCTDKTEVFNTEYRHGESLKSFFDEGSFPDIDPLFKNRPIRRVFGYMDKVPGINIEFSDEPSSTTNRTYVMSVTNSSVTSTNAVSGSGVVDTLVNKLVISSGLTLQVGDDVYFDAVLNNVWTSTVRRTVTDITGTLVTFDSNLPYVATTAIFWGRFPVANLYVNANGQLFKIDPDDYEIYLDASKDVMGVTIDGTDFNTQVGRFIATSDTVFSRVYGDKANFILSMGSFGTNSSAVGVYTSGVGILAKIFKESTGLVAADFNVSAWNAALASTDQEFGFSIPEKSGENFPSIRDLISNLSQSILAKVYVDDDLKWSISLTEPLGSVTKSIEDDEILLNEYTYDFSYADIVSDVFVEYAPSELSSYNQAFGEVYFKTVRRTNNLATYLHGVTSQKTFKSVLFIEAQADDLARRLSYYFGDRRGVASLSSKNRFFDTVVGDVIQVSRDRQPGSVYAQDTNRNLKFAVTEVQKSLNQVTITLDDQKGIEDNSGSW